MFKFFIVFSVFYAFSSLTSISHVQAKKLAKKEGVHQSPQHPPRVNLHKKRPSPSLGPVQDSNRNNCTNRRFYLEQELSELDDYRGELTAVNVEVEQLQAKLRDLRKRSKELKTIVRKQSNRISSIQDRYNGECKNNESCSQYNKMATNLGRRSQPIEQALEKVGSEIHRTRKKISNKKRRVSSLRNDYELYRCSQLIPGQTSQVTIDQCSLIFSQWNQVQTTLNQQQSQLPLLKSRFEQLLVNLTSIHKRAQEIQVYLAANCAKSPRATAILKHTKIRDEARSLGKALDILIEDVNKLKKIKLLRQ